MSASVIIKQDDRPPTGELAGFFRAPALHAVPKKPSVAVKVASGACPADICDPVRQTSTRDFVRSVAHAVLPRPRSAMPWNLWRDVSCDFFLVALAFALVARINLRARAILPQSWNQKPALPSGPDAHLLLGFALLYGALVTLLTYSEGLYQQNALPMRERIALFKGVLWGTLLIAVALWLCAPQSGVVAALPWSAALNLTLLLAWRTWKRRLSAKNGSGGKGTRNVLIVGSHARSRELAQYLHANPQMGRVVKGFLEDHSSSNNEVLGGIEDISDIAKAHFIDEIVLLPGAEKDALRVIRLARRHRLTLMLVPELFGFEPGQPSMDWLGAWPIITLHQEQLPQLALFIKRSLDVMLSSMLLIILFPFMAAIAIAIKCDTRGPLFYSASRVGRKGQRFRCFKFRTMVVSADALKERLRGLNQREGPCFKIASDPRITRVGRFLRRYSLDELPQFWNVLRGEMSLVGPRPHPLDDFSRYELDHLRRLDVTPGITGLWQVTARQDSSFVTALALDLKYIEEWSLWLDLRILFRTLSAVVAGTGV